MALLQEDARRPEPAGYVGNARVIRCMSDRVLDRRVGDVVGPHEANQSRLLRIRTIDCLVARISRTGLDASRAGGYDEFAHSRSLPMFERHDGFRGLLFATAGDERIVITLWRDHAANAALERSKDYRSTVEAIEAAGFLRPPQRLELRDIQDLRFDATAAAAS